MSTATMVVGEWEVVEVRLGKKNLRSRRERHTLLSSHPSLGLSVFFLSFFTLYSSRPRAALLLALPYFPKAKQGGGGGLRARRRPRLPPAPLRTRYVSQQSVSSLARSTTINRKAPAIRKNRTRGF